MDEPPHANNAILTIPIIIAVIILFFMIIVDLPSSFTTDSHSTQYWPLHLRYTHSRRMVS
jgi:hypothetical protein